MVLRRCSQATKSAPITEEATRLSLEQLILQYSTGKNIESQEGKKKAETDKPTPQPFAPLPIYEDPRPDLAEDSHLWNELLCIAYAFHPLLPEKNAEFCGVLNGMRCGGTRLRQGKNGWVLRPDIDPTGRVAWVSQEEYEYFRDKYLKEWFTWLKYALKRLSENHPSKPAS